ncbi:hypothetical protein [Frankia sp. AgB32]|uniref:hypothetical protein n=1 Tax=Frankia sp. AgB32 TaxID=631119 RepID=UPI00200E57C3|nr:hypothetical protein [Frankia sp. AgB32]MCK9894200.1 hypothetical protein [Frankia sp. AgB32]
MPDWPGSDGSDGSGSDAAGGKLDRRRLLRLGTAGIALGTAGGLLAACGGGAASNGAAAAGSAWPSARLPASAAQSIDPQQFLPTSQLQAYGVEADRLGLRATGAANHEGYLRTLAGQFRRAGVADVALEPVPMRQWLATSWSLSAGGGERADTYYVPYSQQTGPGGVTAPMVHLPLGTGDEAAVRAALASVDVKGKIAVFEVAYTALTLQTFIGISYPGAYLQPAGDPRGVSTAYRRPWFNTIARTLDLIAAAGAVGTVGIWPDLPGRWARQYTPYDAVFRPIPGLWIDRDGGARLKELAGNGAPATIRLEATVRDTTTHNLVGYITGRSTELTVLHTHTDGTNGIEENGPIGILAAAQYLARLPRTSLPRTIMIMLSTGHFAGGVGIRHFLTQHAADLVPRISSILTLEHLGTREYLPAADGSIQPTGRTELGTYFAPNSPGLVAATSAAVRRDQISSTVARPFSAGPPDAKQPVGWPGEGTYFWWYGGLPTANYITGPYGLITADLDTTDMVDYSLMRREAMTSVGTILQLAATSSAELRVAAG